MECKNCGEDIEIDEVDVVTVAKDGTIELGVTCIGCGSTYSTWVSPSGWCWNEEE